MGEGLVFLFYVYYPQVPSRKMCKDFFVFVLGYIMPNIFILKDLRIPEQSDTVEKNEIQLSLLLA